jgi:hypothetical protein
MGFFDPFEIGEDGLDCISEFLINLILDCGLITKVCC